MLVLLLQAPLKYLIMSQDSNKFLIRPSNLFTHSCWLLRLWFFKVFWLPSSGAILNLKWDQNEIPYSFKSSRVQPHHLPNGFYI